MPPSSGHTRRITVNIPANVWTEIDTVVKSRGITAESESQLVLSLLEEWLRFTEDRALGKPGKSLEVLLRNEVARLDSELASLRGLMETHSNNRPQEGDQRMKEMKLKALVLVDAENMPQKYFAPLKTAIEKLGCAADYRLYANSFTTGATKPWGSLQGVTRCWNEQALPYYSADRHLAYDASYLAAKPYDQIIIVSSDSDFRQLVIHLQDDGISVLGYGEKDKSADLAKVYGEGKFTHVEGLLANGKKQSDPVELLKARVIIPIFQRLRDQDDCVLAARFGTEFWKSLDEVQAKVPQLQVFLSQKLQRIVELTGGEVVSDPQKELVKYYRWSSL